MTPSALLADANALIDFAVSGPGVLKVAARRYAPIVVPTVLADEVTQLTPRDYKRLGLQLIEPSLEQAIEASRLCASLSFQDRICLIVARDKRWACLTNDKRLRAECAQQGIECVWGLELMKRLVDDGHLAPSTACRVATAIARSNPFVTEDVLRRFESHWRGGR